MKTQIAAFISAGLALSGAAEAACRDEMKDDLQFVVCDFRPTQDDIRLFLNDESGKPFGEFGLVAAALEKNGETLLFAMNAGMYHKDRSPVGLYVENGEERKMISTSDGPGNFHLKPNGVFWVDDAGGAHVTETGAYLDGAHDDVAYATQSGPILVIKGELHPRFLIDATSRKRRNGVGVTEDGTVIFALSDTPVTFHEFATYFRDDLACPNALYLDGTISRLYAPELDRNDPGVAMGPIVGVVKRD